MIEFSQTEKASGKHNEKNMMKSGKWLLTK